MTDAAVLKVETYQVERQRVYVTLANGGKIDLPLLRVERIVDDEIGLEVEIEEVVAVGPILRFRDSDQVPDTPYGQLIFDTARRHAMSPALVAAMVRAESAFDPTAVSSKGARGLMQLMPATAQRFGAELSRIFEPAVNLEAGVKYLKWLSERFDDDLSRVLAGYNAGEGNVERYDGVPPFRETRGYIRRIYSTLGLDEAVVEGAR